MRVRFGDAVYDSERRELTRRGAAVPLSPKAFELLGILIAHRPRALTKEMLYERLWPATFVQPANLNNLVSEIRAALGDSSRELVRTRRRFGFAFAGEACDEGPAPAQGDAIFRLAFGATSFDLRPGRNVIGRDASCAVVLDSPAVSRRHAAIDIRDSVAVLHDLGSRNGTWVERRRLHAPVELHDRNEIEIGRTLLRFRVFDRRATTVSDER
jgi:DNA-binding winged helix-turn-helix (wHTH) protein